MGALRDTLWLNIHRTINYTPGVFKEVIPKNSISNLDPIYIPYNQARARVFTVTLAFSLLASKLNNTAENDSLPVCDLDIHSHSKCFANLIIL